MGKIKVGDKAEFAKTISESDVYLFAGITGDMNPIHINSIEAEKSFVGRRIVHGALVSGLISSVIGMQLPGPGTIYMEQDSKFVNPVFFGDTVIAKVEIAEILNAAKGIIRLSTRVYNQDEKLVIDGYAIVKYMGGIENE